MIENILSIDFDYIMYPCIRLYNDISAGSENATCLWNNIKYARGVEEQFLQYDPESYKAIVKLVKLVMEQNKKAELIPIDEHQKIIDILNKDPEYNDKKYNLVNIDFHHDILYRATDRSSIINFDKYNCSNWVGYLILKDKLEKYIWVKAPNSDNYDHKLDGKYDIKFTIESNRILSDLDTLVKENNFDKIFLCLSPQWVPYKFKHLYDLIIELFTREEE